MKIELEQNNKVFIFEGSNKWELHPIWLRERVSEKEHLDKNTEQRLFDPSFLKDIKIKFRFLFKRSNKTSFMGFKP